MNMSQILYDDPLTQGWTTYRSNCLRKSKREET